MTPPRFYSCMACRSANIRNKRCTWSRDVIEEQGLLCDDGVTVRRILCPKHMILTDFQPWGWELDKYFEDTATCTENRIVEEGSE